MRWIITAAILCAHLPLAHADADDGDYDYHTQTTKPSRLGKNLFYVEALGKGGLYGVGYERVLTKRLSLGAAASYAVLSDQRVLTFAPYVHGTLLEGRRHALFTELGAILAQSHLPSPVSGWDGMTTSGGGGFLSVGWEYTRGHFFLRTSGSIVVGDGGIGPMLGFAAGFRL